MTASPADALPDDLRRAVTLALVERLTVREIADACAWSEEATRERLRRGLSRLGETSLAGLAEELLLRTGAPVPPALLPRLLALAATPPPESLAFPWPAGARRQEPDSNRIFRDPANSRST